MAGGEFELFSGLRAKHGKPIIAISGLTNAERDARLKAAGISILPLPYSIEQFTEALDACLEPERAAAGPPGSVPHPGKTRPPRVAILDDDKGYRDNYLELLKTWFEGVEIIEFENEHDARQELLRTDLDLLITDIHHADGHARNMLADLAEKKVTYPILVISGGLNDYKEDERRGWGPGLNVSFLQKPFEVEVFRAAVETALLIPAGPVATRLKILLVADDYDQLGIYRASLGGLPSRVEIHTAVSGRLALEMLGIEPFHLLICNLHMQKMDGLEVLSIVRRKYPEMRTMIVTADRNKEPRTRAYELGADLYWNKPSSAEEMREFRQRVESLLSPKHHEQ